MKVTIRVCLSNSKLTSLNIQPLYYYHVALYFPLFHTQETEDSGRNLFVNCKKQHRWNKMASTLGTRKKQLLNAAVILCCLFVVDFSVSTSSGACPSMCSCGMLASKVAVNCVQRNLKEFPRNISNSTEIL